MKFKLLANWKIKACLMTILFMTSLGVLNAQTITVKGTVTADGGPLPGASILVKGTTTGAITDFDGKYTIKAKPTDVLLFTYLGFDGKAVKVNGKTVINAELESTASALSEVVVIGYGTQKKKEVTGAVSQVKSEEIMKTSTSDIGAALQGQIAGVNVVSSSGEPGAVSNIFIRGLTSALGSNSPLYIVDGIPFDGDPRLSINEIETIDVLKDAASAAIYGTRGAAGVILITTKKGQMGKMQIKEESYYGIQQITSHLNILNREDRLYLQFLQSYNNNGAVFGNTYTSIETNPTTLTNDSNIVNQIQNDNAPMQNHNISISGGKDGLAYNVSANYFQQEGTVINSDFERINVRANTQFKKGKWDIATGISFSTQDKGSAPWGILKDAYRYNPSQSPINTGVDSVDDVAEGSTATNLSYLGARLLQTDQASKYYFDGNISLTYNFSKDFKYTGRFSASYDNGDQIVINPKFVAYNLKGEKIASPQSKIYNQSSLAKKTTAESILNYNKKFGNHQFNLTAVYSAERYIYSSFFGSKFDIQDNSITVINGATGTPNAGSGSGQWSQDRENTLIGMLGRMQYNYKGKYLFSASVRRDGSSRFQKQPWGVFPSFSAGWNVSDEDFWKNIKKTVTSFKLRASQGTTGNQGIADYSYSSVIVLENDYVFGNGTSTNLQTGATQQAYGNENIKWETSVSTNFGYDLSFLNNSLTFSSDIYRTNKKDMLLPVVLAPTTGVGIGSDSEVVLNVGDMVNQGVELASTYRHVGKNWKWNAGLTYSKNENTVTKMADTNKEVYFKDSNIAGTDNDTDYVNALIEGYTAGSFFLIKTNGVISTSGQLTDYLQEFPTSGAQIGDLRYVDKLTVDTNNDGIADKGDGIIDINDRQFAGSGTPSFEMGFNLSVEYKNFDFSTQVYGSFGAEIINGSKAYGYQNGAHQDLVYQWSPQNPTSTIPVFRGNTTHNNVRGWSDYWIEDGSFVRLRNISIGYTLPKKSLSKFGIEKLRFYVSGQNLITLTKYTGFDPEVGNNGLSTRGIDKGNYPVSSMVKTGLQLEF